MDCFIKYQVHRILFHLVCFNIIVLFICSCRQTEEIQQGESLVVNTVEENVNIINTKIDSFSCEYRMLKIIGRENNTDILDIKENSCDVNRFLKVNNRVLTPLHLALRNRDIEMVDSLLQYGADPNMYPPGYINPFIYSIYIDDATFFYRLLEHGGDVNFVDSTDFNVKHPLSVAIHNGKTEIVNTLLASGANPNGPNLDNKLYDSCILPISLAIIYDNIDLVRVLIDLGVDLTKKYTLVAEDCWPCPNEITPIHELANQYASGKDSNRLKIEDLVLTNAKNLNIRNGNNETPLDWVAYTNDTILANKFINKGALIEEKDRSSLYHAAIFSNYAMVKFFLEKGADPNYKSLTDNYTPLLRAINCCGDGFGEMITANQRFLTYKVLIEYGAKTEYENRYTGKIDSFYNMLSPEIKYKFDSINLLN